jgi:hypothetical protein
MSWPTKNPISLQRLLWHAMMGIALGVICGGLLLISDGPEVQSIPGSLGSLTSRLVFLIFFGFWFGLGATMTGALFLANEET